MSRRELLRLATEQQHAALDRLIDEKNYFESVKGYGDWLLSGFGFHRDMQHQLTGCQATSELPLRALQERTTLLLQDLADLSLAPTDCLPSPGNRLSISEALGTLYVTEGAALGSRVLLVRAKRLGLSGTRGARHLAYAAHGLDHWRKFLGLLEEFECRPDEEYQMIAAAQRAFATADMYWRRP